MKINRSQKIREHVALAKGIQAELSRLIRRKLRGADLKEEGAANWYRLLQEVELSAETFAITTKQLSADAIDRKKSMLTGPFFTSDEFSAPATLAGKLFPLVQLELNEISAAVQEDLGDGLFQLWYDLNSQTEFIRVIPLDNVYAQELTAFDWKLPAGINSFPLPSYWNTDPCGEMVQQIVGLTSKGVQCQCPLLDCYADLIENESDWVWVLAKLFNQNTRPKTEGEVNMFGAFYPIQYSAADVGKKCLLRIADWGSSGGAQIFYKTTKNGETQFNFWNCVR